MTKQVAVVTGSNGDMGQAICASLKEDGYIPVGIDRGDSGRGEFAYKQCDLTKLDQLTKTLADIEKTHGLIRVLVNNAGIWNGKQFFDITPEDYNLTFEVNARGTFFATQLVAKRLIEAEQGGSIVNIASVVGRTGCPIPDYAGSKAAIILFTRSLAKTLGPSGIRINAIAPGTVDTAMSRRLPADRRAEIHAGIALRRAGEPREIAEAVSFLVGPRSSYMTGATIDVNGGMW